MIAPTALRARAVVITGTHSPASFARCLSIPLAELTERRRLWPAWAEILGDHNSADIDQRRSA